MRVLVVEDEVRLAKNIAQILKESCGYAVDISNNGSEGLHFIETNSYDLIVLDVMLPEIDGFEIILRMRARDIATPVLMLTAKSSGADIIKGLNSGSDDYLTKPFDIGELVARCKALVRRCYGKPNPEIKVGNISINTLTRRVKVDDREAVLTAMEYKTLEYLALRAGEVVTKTEILEHLYDFNWERFSNVIESYVSSLRRKLDPDKSLNIIETVRGHGYLLKA